MHSLKDPRKRSLTQREQRKAILDRLDTVTQAIRQARARADKLDIANALAAALASATAAQKHIESTMTRDAL